MSVMRGALTLLLVCFNTLVWGTVILLLAVPKFLLRGALRRRLIIALSKAGDRWAGGFGRIFDALLPTQWDVSGAEELNPDGHYLIFSNHISWTDIFTLFRLFHDRVAFLRFFIKQELIWVPFLGQAAWALELPFMKRYSADYLARHPEKRGRDLETTYRACQRYRLIPVAIVNFLEGTRFTREKHEEQQSPYRYLLRPRVGGAGFVLASLGDQLDGVIDVTIAYPGHEISMWDFVTGRVPRVIARARRIDVPPEFYDRAIVEPGPARDRFKAWIEGIWAEKDEEIARMLAQ